MKTMKSAFLLLNFMDLVKGFILAIIMSLITATYQAIQAGAILFTWVFWQPIVYTAIAAGLAYLIKNLFTNSSDQILTKETK
jgi:hypothetical protein